MNNKGQTLGLTILSSVIIFIVGMMCLNFIMPTVTDTRIDLSCSSASTISDGVKLFCLLTDSIIPYWILLVFSITGGAIFSRFAI